jgi:nucleotide-binding universal stress UspA family protein
MHIVSNEPVSLPDKNYVEKENYSPISTTTGQFPRRLDEPPAEGYEVSDEVDDEISEGYANEEQTLLSEAALLFRQEGITAEEKFAEGADVAETIIAETETGKYDLIVIGNSGTEEKELDLHLGSVAERVSSAVKIPILIVRQKTKINNILIPVDGSEKDEHALLKASVIAKKAGAKVVLLHVQEASLLRRKPEAKEIGPLILKKAAAQLEGLQVEQKLVSGDAAKIIIQTSLQEDVDLIVMSRGARGMLRRFPFGSVSSHVLHYATVPLLLVR